MGTVEFTPGQHEKEGITAHVIWMTTGLSCDGDSVAMTSATASASRSASSPPSPALTSSSSARPPTSTRAS